MHRPITDAPHLKHLGKLIQAPMQILAEPHQVLDVKDDWEVDVEQLKEFSLVCRDGLAGQNLEQVAEVVPTAHQEHQKDASFGFHSFKF